MNDVIFQQRQCLKKDVFQTIVDLLKGAGWKDISSDPATDFVVMQSSGESGDKNLLFQIRPTSVTNTNDTTSTDNNVMSLRLVSDYTPGEGQAGTFSRNESWRALYIVPSATLMNQENEMTIWYNVNKDRIIFVIESPESLGVAPCTHYIGLPEAFINEPGSKGVIFASSTYAATASSILITDNADTIAPATTSATRTTYINLPPRSPNSGGKHTPVQMYYGNGTEGYRGRIDGLYFLPANAISNGDTLTVGNKTFRGVVNGVANNNSFITSTMLFQIS